jgi:co-chaperonin GroES (HSP10)
MNKITPTQGNILVKPYEKPSEVGGLQLVGDQQNNAPVRGEILEVASPSKFQAGQHIFFRKYAIDELSYINEDGKETKVWLVDEREVLAVLE